MSQGGFGLVFKMDVGTASLSTVGKILDMDFPAQENVIAEKTTHDSTSGYYEAIATGKKRLTPFTMTLEWDVSVQTAHAEILTVFGTGAATDMSIEDPDGDEVIAFQGIVERILRQSRQEEVFKCTVQVHPTGAPTIT